MLHCFKPIYLSLGLIPATVLTAFSQGAEQLHQIKVNPQHFNNGYYYEEIPLHTDNTPLISIESISKKAISAEDVQYKDAIANSFEPDISVGTNRKQKTAYLKIPAVVFNNGTYEQVEQIVYKTTELPTRTSRARRNYADNSILATGTWQKFSIAQRGIYKIGYNDLMAMGINPSQIDPKNIRVFGNNGTVINETVNSTDADDLTENAIFVSSTGNTFGANDYILMYANGPIKWSPNFANNKFEHTSNYYEDKSFYFITTDLGTGKRVPTQNLTNTTSRNINTYNEYALIEKDTFSVSRLGKTWWTYEFKSTNPSLLTQTYNFSILPPIGNVNIKANVGSTSASPNNRFQISANNTSLPSVTLGAVTSQDYYFTENEIEGNVAINGANLSLKYQYIPNGVGIGFVDYTTLNYLTNLRLNNGLTVFRNLENANRGNGTFASYALSGANSSTIVWEVTNDLEPVAIRGQLNGETFSFVSETNKLREFIAFDGSKYLSPTPEGRVENQNLHALGHKEMIIITNNDLEASAHKFAEFHRNHDGITVEVVTIDKIYNEFSSGSRDISGIRNFIKMFYDRATNDSEIPKGIMFLGKASFDYKDKIESNGSTLKNTNIVPTFQSLASNSNYSAYCSDDFYGILDDGENIENNSTFRPTIMDVAVGRIPVTTNAEAEVALAKIKNYVSANSYGPWKNTITYVADDKDGPASGSMNHLNDCESANNLFFTDYRNYNLNKIYADAYNPTQTSSGTRFPDANKAINDQAYNGTLFMSYSGHGSPERWATEALLTKNDYSNWNNFDKLPLIFTGTCDFSRFDNPLKVSAGVELFNKPNGGAIALMSTTQVVFASSNTRFSKAFVQQQFTPNADGTYKTLGEVSRLAKNTNNADFYNSKMYVLLGDPLLKLQIPVNHVVTDSIIDIASPNQLASDTLSALGRYKISGHIKNPAGQKLTNFNGKVYISILDKPINIQTVQSTNNPTPNFKLQNNTLAKVVATVENGEFSTDFILPKDIIYDFGNGKISYYAHSDAEEAKGVDTNFVIGGTHPYASPNDNKGPIVKAYIDDDKFRDGGVTGANPMLYVKLYDDNGINVAGNSVGHDLTAVLDDNVAQPYNMNTYYNVKENDYTNGYVYFPFYNLADGLHNIKVKAWDVYNNSGEGMVTFEVKNGEVGFIGEIYNYPNPFTDQTRFVIQHNQANTEMDVIIKIYSTNGALVAHKIEHINSDGNRMEIIWDGKTLNGQPLNTGIYYYKVDIKTASGLKASATQKLVYLPK